MCAGAYTCQTVFLYNLCIYNLHVFCCCSFALQSLRFLYSAKWHNTTITLVLFNLFGFGLYSNRVVFVIFHIFVYFGGFVRFRSFYVMSMVDGCHTAPAIYILHECMSVFGEHIEYPIHKIRACDSILLLLFDSSTDDG